MPRKVSVNNRIISNKAKPYIIAEISANHNGSIKMAKDTILAAKKTGVDAVKIQTYTPDTMTIDSKNKDFFINSGLWKNRSLYDLYKEAYTPYEWHKELFDLAKKNKITLFSTPFDESAVDLLESLETPAYKVSSFELVDLPLIKYIAKTKKPIFLSTGMAKIREIREAINTIKSQGSNKIIILHCISGYPTPIDQANLNGIKLLKKEFNFQIGLSDHTSGTLASIVAISLGASVIEKHFTISKSIKGVDTKFSIDPIEMKTLVQDTSNAFMSLGSKNTLRSNIENYNKTFRRSIYFVRDLKKGEIITEQHIKRIRPGFGLAPKYYNDIIGKKVIKNVKIGERVTKSKISLLK